MCVREAADAHIVHDPLKAHALSFMSRRRYGGIQMITYSIPSHTLWVLKHICRFYTRIFLDAEQDTMGACASSHKNSQREVGLSHLVSSGTTPCVNNELLREIGPSFRKSDLHSAACMLVKPAHDDKTTESSTTRCDSAFAGLESSQALRWEGICVCVSFLLNVALSQCYRYNVSTYQRVLQMSTCPKSCSQPQTFAADNCVLKTTHLHRRSSGLSQDKAAHRSMLAPFTDDASSLVCDSTLGGCTLSQLAAVMAAGALSLDPEDDTPPQLSQQHTTLSTVGISAHRQAAGAGAYATTLARALSSPTPCSVHCTAHGPGHPSTPPRCAKTSLSPSSHDLLFTIHHAVSMFFTATAACPHPSAPPSTNTSHENPTVQPGAQPGCNRHSACSAATASSEGDTLMFHCDDVDDSDGDHDDITHRSSLTNLSSVSLTSGDDHNEVDCDEWGLHVAPLRTSTNLTQGGRNTGALGIAAGMAGVGKGLPPSVLTYLAVAGGPGAEALLAVDKAGGWKGAAATTTTATATTTTASTVTASTVTTTTTSATAAVTFE